MQRTYLLTVLGGLTCALLTAHGIRAGEPIVPLWVISAAWGFFLGATVVAYWGDLVRLLQSAWQSAWRRRPEPAVTFMEGDRLTFTRPDGTVETYDEGHGVPWWQKMRRG